MKRKIRSAIDKAPSNKPKRFTFSLCAVAHRLLLEEQQERLDLGLPPDSLGDIVNEVIMQQLGKGRSKAGK